MRRRWPCCTVCTPWYFRRRAARRWSGCWVLVTTLKYFSPLSNSPVSACRTRLLQYLIRFYRKWGALCAHAQVGVSWLHGHATVNGVALFRGHGHAGEVQSADHCAELAGCVGGVHKLPIWLDTLENISYLFLEIGNGKIADKVAELQDWLHPLKNVSVFWQNKIRNIPRRFLLLLTSTCLSFWSTWSSTAKRSAICRRVWSPRYGLWSTSRCRQIRSPYPVCMATCWTTIQPCLCANVICFTTESTVELKYKYVLIELYSADCLTTLTNIMQVGFLLYVLIVFMMRLCNNVSLQ